MNKPNLETMTTPSPQMISKAEQLFEDLLGACKCGDLEKQKNLKVHWETLVAYVRTLDEDQINNRIESHVQKINLVLWLTTTPDPQQIPFPRTFPESVLLEREQLVGSVHQALLDWMERSSLVTSIGEYGLGRAWQSLLSGTLASLEIPTGPREVRDELAEQVVTVSSAIGARLEQFILDSELPTFGARIRLSVKGNSIQFHANDEHLSASSVMQSVRSLTGLPSKHVKSFSRALLLSLPRHQDLLPEFSAECEKHVCWLCSTCVDPIELAEGVPEFIR